MNSKLVIQIQGDERSDTVANEKEPESRLEYRGLAEYTGFSDKQKCIVSWSITGGDSCFIVLFGFLPSFVFYDIAFFVL